MTISEAFYERGAVAAAGLREGGPGSAVDCIGVIALDYDAFETIGRSAIRRRILTADLADWRDGKLPPPRNRPLSANIRCSVAEETNRDIFFAKILRPPGRATSDWKVRPDNRIRSHDPMFDRGQMHGPPFATHQSVVAKHQFAKDFFHWDSTSQGVGVAAVRAERLVAPLHGGAEPRCDRLLAEREMASSFDEILQEEVVSPLFAIPDFHLNLIKLQSLFQTNVIIGFPANRRRRLR